MKENKLKTVYRRLMGDWLQPMVEEIRCTTTEICGRVDDLLTRAQIDGEDRWFLTEKKRKKRDDSKRNDQGFTI